MIDNRSLGMSSPYAVNEVQRLHCTFTMLIGGRETHDFSFIASDDMVQIPSESGLLHDGVYLKFVSEEIKEVILLVTGDENIWFEYL